jgi:hypothetical protein
MAGLETENNMIVAGRADQSKLEQPLMYSIAQVANDIGTIQAALKVRVEARAK